MYAFLVGLDDIFDKVHSDILRTLPLPFVEEVFYVVMHEAQRHATVMGESTMSNQGRASFVATVSRPHVVSRPPLSFNSSLNSCPLRKQR